MKTKWFSILFFFTLLITPCYSYEQNKIYRLTILHTNDLHGHYWPDPNRQYGGLAAQKTLIDKIKTNVENHGGFVLILSSGDINTGYPASDLFNAEPTFKAMKIIGYDAMAVGNHEFDNPYSILKQQEKWAEFPFLSANVFYKDSNKRPFSPYLIEDIGGLKVAIMGLLTEETKRYPYFYPHFDIKSPIEITQQIIPKLENKSDIIIALTHLGLNVDKELAKNTHGIDFILGGHSQEEIYSPIKIKSTYITQSYEWGKYVGRLDIEFKNGKITLKNYQLIPVNYSPKGKSINHQKQISEDPTLKHFLQAYYDNAKKELLQPIGYSNREYNGHIRYIRYKRMPMGTLVAKENAKATGSDIGIINSGAIRADLLKGIITTENIISIHPFRTKLSTVCLSKPQLFDYVNTLSKIKPGAGGFMQYSGMELVYKDGKLAEIKYPPNLNHKKCIKVSINEFIANGGDLYPNMSHYDSYKLTNITLQSALICYFNNKCNEQCRKKTGINQLKACPSH